MRRPAVVAHKLHKWLGLIVGAQVLVWLLSGLYMVAVDIDFIHGDSLVRHVQKEIGPGLQTPVELARLRAEHPTASRISLKRMMDRLYYTVTTPETRYLVDAGTGLTVSPLDEQTVRAIAEFNYNGVATIDNTALITTDAPREIGSRPLPLWRVDFSDSFATSFYIDPIDGALVTRRHRYWRWFDVLWMLHIMDYDERTDVHHPLLVSAQSAALLLAISGAFVLVYQLSRRKRGRKTPGGVV